MFPNARHAHRHTEQPHKDAVSDDKGPESALDSVVQRRLEQLAPHRFRLVKLLEVRTAREEAEDLAHDAMLRVAMALTPLEGDIWPYLRQTAVNLMYSHFERVARHKVLVSRAELRPETVSFEETVINRRMATQLIGVLLEAEDAITVNMLCAKEAYGLTFAQVGEWFGLSASAAQSRIQRARVHVRAIVREHGEKDLA